MPLPVVTEVAGGEVLSHKVEAGVSRMAWEALRVGLQPAGKGLDDVGMVQVQRQPHLPPDVHHLLWRQVIGALQPQKL